MLVRVAEWTGWKGRTVDVVDAALVVARNERVEKRDAVLVRWLDAAERGGVDDGLVIGVAVSGVVEDAAVDTLRKESGLGSKK